MDNLPEKIGIEYDQSTLYVIKKRTAPKVSDFDSCMCQI